MFILRFPSGVGSSEFCLKQRLHKQIASNQLCRREYTSTRNPSVMITAGLWNPSQSESTWCRRRRRYPKVDPGQTFTCSIHSTIQYSQSHKRPSLQLTHASGMDISNLSKICLLMGPRQVQLHKGPWVDAAARARPRLSTMTLPRPRLRRAVSATSLNQVANAFNPRTVSLWRRPRAARARSWNNSEKFRCRAS